jgi:hypothetical protein
MHIIITAIFKNRYGITKSTVREVTELIRDHCPFRTPLNQRYASKCKQGLIFLLPFVCIDYTLFHRILLFQSRDKYGLHFVLFYVPWLQESAIGQPVANALKVSEAGQPHHRPHIIKYGNP